MQFLPEGRDGISAQSGEPYVKGEPVGDANIEAMLANLAQAPLGVDREREFRISLADAQEKTALLRRDGQWFRPVGSMSMTHILKPQLVQVPGSDGMIDMSDSVDNEHY